MCYESRVSTMSNKTKDSNMRHLAIVIAAALAIVAASPLEVQILREKLFLGEENTRNSALEQLFLSLLEELRELMVTGSDTVPILDPLTIDKIHVDENTISIIPGHVTINDLSVAKISTFEINELSVTITSLLLQRYRIILDGSVPVVDVGVGDYDLNLSVFGGSIFGKGDATIKIVEPRIRTNLLMSISLSGGIYLNLLECQIHVSLASFEPKITGLFNDPVLSDFISSFLQNLVPEMLEFFEEEITEFLSTTVLEVGNNILREFDLSAILGI
ncbi:unnamed protein product [Parnassius apollo]|uniref:(apollo) hypothetical protein n=1 Tax=Parnassius apollo TaxID=110799 RepID=A0A8S3XHY0_PARAO|nr:unnamed protein product [Parnassius apollo]